MKSLISGICLIFISILSFGQDDTKRAKEILDQVSANMDGYKTLTVRFKVTIYTEDEPIDQSGMVYIKGDKYKLDLDDQEIYCDGENITTYLKEDNECYKGKVADQEDASLLSPSELLTIWEDGYRYRYGGETTYASENCFEIFLYPKDPESSKYHTIKLLVNENRMEVVWVYLRGRDGNHLKYKLLEMKKDEPMGDAMFVFNEASHPGVECYDE